MGGATGPVSSPLAPEDDQVDLVLDVDERNGHMVLRVQGEVDFFTVPPLRDQLSELIIQGHRQIVVDLDGVKFLDSMGLGVLVNGLKRLRQDDGSLVLVCTQPRLLRIFEITALDKVFRIYDSVDAAIITP